VVREPSRSRANREEKFSSKEKTENHAVEKKRRAGGIKEKNAKKTSRGGEKNRLKGGRSEHVAWDTCQIKERGG